MSAGRMVAVGASIVLLVLVLAGMVGSGARHGAKDLGPSPTGDGDAVVVAPRAIR